MVKRSSRRCEIGRETLLDVWKWSGVPPGGPEVVGSPTRRSGSGRETLPEVRKWSGDPTRGLEVVGKPYRRSGMVGRPAGRS